MKMVINIPNIFIKKNNKNLSTAILFQKMIVGDDVVLEIPVRVLLGHTDEKKQIFNDTLSNTTFINSDLTVDSNINYCFNWVTDINELYKEYKTKDIKVLFPKYLKDIRENVYFYSEEEYVMNILPVDDFKYLYGYTVKYTADDVTLESLKEMLELGDEPEIAELDDDELEKDKDINDFKISTVCEKVKKTVIAQDDAIKRIVTAIYKNNMFDDLKMKSNIFIYGPTGVGKTEIVRTLGNIFDLPVLVEDMTQYTSAGYKGSDIEGILAKLYNMCDGNLEEAERAILVLDEIDKKASEGSDRDFNKADVLKSLLKIIEGDTFEIDLGPFNKINFDTSKLTVIACGAYSDLLSKLVPQPTVGFGSTNTKLEAKEYGISDFIKYGMVEEFMGRFDTIVRLNSLGEEDLVRVLKESDKSPLKVYLNNLKKIGIDLEINDTIYEKIAHKAITYKTGARALKLVVDEMFQEILYDIFDNPNKEIGIEITEDTIVDNRAYKVKQLSM